MTTFTRPDTPEREMLETYAAWLFYERRRLCDELWPGSDAAEDIVKVDNPAAPWHFGRPTPLPSSRAEAVLRLVGCPLTHGDARASDGGARHFAKGDAAT